MVVMLPELRSVKLTFLPNFRRLEGGVVSAGFARGTFTNLKELDVRGCCWLSSGAPKFGKTDGDEESGNGGDN